MVIAINSVSSASAKAAAKRREVSRQNALELNVDPQSYKQGMRRLASGVTIVTTQFEGQSFGLLSTGVSSVSMNPPVLLVCVNRLASSHDPIAHSGRFCVNVLRQSDRDLANRFSSSSHRASRFIDRQWQALVTGAPGLVGCLASFDCVVTRALSAETHTVFFGDVAEVRLWSDTIDPLLYWDGTFHASAPK